MIDKDIKPEIMKSMTLPWTPRPFYSKAKDTTPTGPRKERRVRKIRRMFWHLKDDLGLLAMAILIVLTGAIFVGALSGIEAWFR